MSEFDEAELFAVREEPKEEYERDENGKAIMPADIKAEFGAMPDKDAAFNASVGVLQAAVLNQETRISVIAEIMATALVEDLGFHR